MQLPRKGILIRLCIYVPLLGYFGWRAYERWWTETHPPAAEPDPLEPYKRKVVLPDGTEQEVIELSRDQAEQLIGPLPPEGAPTPGEVRAGKPDDFKPVTSEGKANDAKPAGEGGAQ